MLYLRHRPIYCLQETLESPAVGNLVRNAQDHSSIMPPKGKKKGGETEELGAMRAARFGRVKNTLSMGFGTFVVSFSSCRMIVFLRALLHDLTHIPNS